MFEKHLPPPPWQPGMPRPLRRPVRPDESVPQLEISVRESDRWQFYTPRKGDIIVATTAKSGTTWLQNIALHLVAPEALKSTPLWQLSLWIDGPTPVPPEDVCAKLDQQLHTRVMKTHLPLCSIPWYPEVRYLVVGRDLRDVGISLWNFYRSFSEEEHQPGRSAARIPRCPATFDAFWTRWATQGTFIWETDGFPFLSPTLFWRSWWKFRHLPNIKLVHYDDLLAQPQQRVMEISRFLEVEIDEDRAREIAEATSFSRMRENAKDMIFGEMLAGGAQSFFPNGKSGQWRDMLTPEQLTLYRRMATLMQHECVDWLETGRL